VVGNGHADGDVSTAMVDDIPVLWVEPAPRPRGRLALWLPPLTMTKETVLPSLRELAAIVATPDWTRPGMRDLFDPSRALPQGRPDALAQWLYDHLDPMTQLDAYARGAAITFECAADDTHVPPDGALRFQRALREAHPAAAERVRVSLHPGLGHLDGARDRALAGNALAWLLDSVA
jgi:hypothetical protein